MSIPDPTAQADENRQAFFTTLASSYSQSTANSTYSIVEDVLNSVKLGINGHSIIHDNGSGPGTATSAVLAYCSSRAIMPPKIYATDSNEAMIEALREHQSKTRDATQAGSGWPTVHAEVMDSHALKFDNDYFTYSFCNMSIFTFSDPLRALYEIHRTLKPAGIAVVTCWKRFGFGDVMGRAQKIVKGHDYEAITKGPGPEFFGEGYLASLLDKAGWESGKIKTITSSILIKPNTGDMSALKEFTKGPKTDFIRATWSDEEKQKWSGAIDRALEEEADTHGGALMEAWVVLARKWDALCA